jgi:protein-tyrosine phosphatase
LPICVSPSKTFRSILDAIDLSLAGDRLVYLHCFGGVGRTGTAVCCWMLRHGLAEPHNVIEMLQKLRQADQQTKGRTAPENNEQIKFVEEWTESACE